MSLVPHLTGWAVRTTVRTATIALVGALYLACRLCGHREGPP